MKSETKYYQSRLARITGTNYTEVRGKAWAIYRDIETQTGNRNTYVRSAYFQKQKVFLKTFWNHLYDKRLGQRMQRMPYYAAAIDLLKNSRVEPEIYHRDNEKRYRSMALHVITTSLSSRSKRTKKAKNTTCQYSRLVTKISAKKKKPAGVVQ
ncbi:MAG: hypothetical protein LBL84_03725 [Candidatus Nomurabacteria bacterium]|jgi:hypothetical protein|nr:hypothetical protein [Candidatus Nomurabacteria bacterium]